MGQNIIEKQYESTSSKVEAPTSSPPVARTGPAPETLLAHKCSGCGLKNQNMSYSHLFQMKRPMTVQLGYATKPCTECHSSLHSHAPACLRNTIGSPQLPKHAARSSSILQNPTSSGKKYSKCSSPCVPNLHVSIQ